MDEPLSNLDALLRVLMRSELKKLQRKLKVTTLYVTHDQVEAMVMADKIAVMNRGRIMQVGSPSEIYNKPANMFVAGFIGSPRMNFIEMQIEDGKLVAGDIKISLSSEIAEKLHDYKSLIAGIRPEDIYPVDRGIPPNVKPLVMRGTVDFIETLGSDTIIHIKVGDILLIAKVPGGYSANIGEKIEVALDLNKLHIFEKSGKRAII